MESLSEYLTLSGVSAKIIALLEIAEKDYSEIEWELDITMSGPDLRYNNARTTLFASDVVVLVSILEKALKNMKKLKEISFSGTYNKQVGEWPEAPRSGVKVSVYGPYRGEMTVRIQIETEDHVFSRFLDEDETVEWINELRKAPEIGNQLVKTLKTII